MQYTESLTDCLKGRAPDYGEPIDWQSTCEQVNDPRRKQGKRFSITAILLLALSAILSNHLSELAIAQWGAGLSEERKKTFGFENGVTPHQSTIQRLFRKLNVEEVEAAFRQIMVQSQNSEQEKRGEVVLSIDGKAQRGRLKFEEKKGYPVHAVSLVAHQTGIVWSQGHVEKTDLDLQTDPASVKKPGEAKEPETEEEKKQKSELAVAARLILHFDWAGKVLTGDALYCQRCLCMALRLAGGDYLFLVKANQPTLLEEIQLLFAPVPVAKRAGQGVLRLPEQTAQTSEKGQGRVDIRAYSGVWRAQRLLRLAGLGNRVFEIRRRWQAKGQWHEAVRYGVTSLPAAIALPERLLKLKRGHWTIENGLHYVKDVTMGEDKSLVHLENGPKIMAALRNTAISLLRRAGFSTIAARMRYNSTHPQAALELLSLS